MLEDLLDQRKSVRSFKDKEVSEHDLNELIWAGYGGEEHRYVPSAGAIYPLQVFYRYRDTLDYYGAPAYIIIAVDYDKITKRYGERGKRYAILEAGHVAQNITLRAIELGLGTVMIGAFRDRRIKKRLNIDTEPLYIIAVGYERS